MPWSFPSRDLLRYLETQDLFQEDVARREAAQLVEGLKGFANIFPKLLSAETNGGGRAWRQPIDTCLPVDISSGWKY